MVVDFDTSAFAETNTLQARILKLRAHIQLGQADRVISELNSEAESNPDLNAVRILAQHTQKPSDQSIIEKAATLAKSNGQNLTVQLLCGTMLANAGRKDEALALLAKHQGSLDACVVPMDACYESGTNDIENSVALIVQIQLSQNRLDLAQQEVRRARSWAQDNLLVNIAEAWVGLREVNNVPEIYNSSH